MRRWIAIAILAFCPPTVALAQERPEDNVRKVAERVAPVYPDLARAG